MTSPTLFRELVREFMETPPLTPSIDTIVSREVVTREEDTSYGLACEAARLSLDRPPRVESTFPNPFIDLHYSQIQDGLQKRQRLNASGMPIQPSEVLALTPDNSQIQELARRQGISPEQFVRNVDHYEAEMRKLYRSLE